MKVNEAPKRTLVAEGQKQYVVATDTSSYSARFDMIACITGDRVLPPIIYSPADRRRLGVQGITLDMLKNYISDLLAQSVGAVDQYPMILVFDRSTIHHSDEVLVEFHLNGGQNLKEVIKMPTQSAKRLSPLDNGLFHDWKQRVRQHGPLTEQNMKTVMSDEWNATTKQQLKSYFHHCGITYGSPQYADCPRPSAHLHPSP